MGKARVRVEAKRLPLNANRMERERNAIQLLRTFKKACSDYGIMQMLKEREFFVRKTDIRRRKKLQKIAVTRQEYRQPEWQQYDNEW